MIILLEPGASPEQRDTLVADLKTRGYGIHLSEGVERTLIGVIGAFLRRSRIAATAGR